jgi:hypothetical protein
MQTYTYSPAYSNQGNASMSYLDSSFVGLPAAAALQWNGWANPSIKNKLVGSLIASDATNIYNSISSLNINSSSLQNNITVTSNYVINTSNLLLSANSIHSIYPADTIITNAYSTLQTDVGYVVTQSNNVLQSVSNIQNLISDAAIANTAVVNAANSLSPSALATGDFSSIISQRTKIINDSILIQSCNNNYTLYVNSSYAWSNACVVSSEVINAEVYSSINVNYTNFQKSYTNALLASNNALVYSNIIPNAVFTISSSMNIITGMLNNFPAMFGGTLTTINSSNIVTFTTIGTSTLFVGNNSIIATYLIVAGGGAGGSDRSGGGGGGGIVYGTQTFTANTSYTITVGAGGQGIQTSSTTGGSGYAGNNGGNSSINGINAIGGGGGGGCRNTIDRDGKSGGSGGGGSFFGTNGIVGSAIQPGSASGGFGYAGGLGAASFAGGGGGGAGTVGQNASSGKGGNGGDGLSFNISGTLQTYSGGGGGGININSGTAGIGAFYGGGGNGTVGNGSNATYYGGGGGGSGIPLGTYLTGGNGYQGIVIIAYLKSS